MIIKLLGSEWACNLHIARDTEGNLYMDLIDHDGELIAEVTKWILGLRGDEVAIKSYSENEGLYEQLLEKNIILPAHRWVDMNWVNFPICYLHPDTYQLLEVPTE